MEWVGGTCESAGHPQDATDEAPAVRPQTSQSPALRIVLCAVAKILFIHRDETLPSHTQTVIR